MRIRRFNLGNGAEKPAKAAGAIRHAGLHAGKGEDHIIGGEGLSIMPSDITPELHFPNRIGHHTPAFREARLRAGAFIAFHQPVKNMMRQRIIRPDIVEMRVNGGDWRAEADRQRLRAWRADGQGQRDQRRQQGFGGVVSWQAQAILRGMAGVDFRGADFVEVAPAYDVAEITALAAATMAWEYLCLFAKRK